MHVRVANDCYDIWECTLGCFSSKKYYNHLSRPICDPIQKELEGPTKDRPAYWNAFARWISLHQHYIIDGNTYKRHTMPHEYNIILHKSTIRLRMKHKQKLKQHPPCYPRLPTWNLSPNQRRSRRRTQRKQASLSRHHHRTTCTCNCCCSNLWATRTQQSHYHGYQD